MRIDYTDSSTSYIVVTIEPGGHKNDLQIPLMKVNSFTINPEVTGFRKETEEAKPRK